MFKRKKKTISSPELDTEFYGEYYNDLSDKSDEDLQRHWQQYGIHERRSPNIQQLLKNHELHNINEYEFEIDPDFYCRNYPDIGQSGGLNKTQAKIHWLIHGKKEGRARTLAEWMKTHGGYASLSINENDIEKFIDLNKDNDQHVTIETIQDVLRGKIFQPIKFADNPGDNASFYERLGKSFYLTYKEKGSEHERLAARSAYQLSLYFHSTARVLELLGNTYLDAGDFRAALNIYYEAQIKTTKNHKENSSRYLYTSLAKAESACHLHYEALTTIAKGCNSHPEFTQQIEQLDLYARKYFTSLSSQLQSLAILDKRKDLRDITWQCTENIYKSYLSAYGDTNNPNPKVSINSNRILIVGDYHIPQCVRYRINQKAEQLKRQGKIVTCISWTDLADKSNELALNDIVIFYRVPAVPEVIKAIAKVNAAGKLSFFEIDDLLFDTLYPANLESYGGYVTLDTHIELRKGMGLFYAAARLCQYGIASTLPLCEKLKVLVSNGMCLLHRNGIDDRDILRNVEQKNDGTIDIFYGSGTQAHNSDFTELALPALTRILQKYPHVRLIIVGYLKLPTHFIENFSSQLKQVPPISSIKAYLSLLQQADINLAVLHDDPINACKSELKWLEAARFSVPSVLSSTQNYRDVLIDGEDALLVTSKEEWFTALCKLVENKNLRQQLAQKSFAKAEENYSTDSLGRQFATQLDGLVSKKPKKHKIALVNVFFPPQSIGGATRVVADNAAILQHKYGNDIELTVFTTDERCTKPYQLETYRQEGITVYRSTVLHRENMDWHPQDPEMYSLFEKFLELEKPDLVHFHCVQRLTGSVVEATKNAGIPYIVTVHDAWWISDYQFLVDSNGKVYSEGHPDRFAPRALPNNITFSQSIERAEYLTDLLLGANKLLTVSESFAEIYRKNGINQIHINRNGISSNQPWALKETSESKKVICGHIGGMSEHKGYFLLKSAIEKLQPNNIELIVVDHSKDENYLEKTLWGIVPVTILGRFSQDNIVELYRQIDVLFSPSIWPESFGLVTREAAACGCWIVASDRGGIGEDIIEGETGFIIKPEAECLNKVLNTINCNTVKFKGVAPPKVIRFDCSQVDELFKIYGTLV
ncbi:glycosyltransferase [Candidatus Pantoea floridensis]|uniref:Glycosyltransferase involved in cell wall bisynthesis n=1 Tax=Candidatus Pantoea floridensis TaxID=1938870 RepID=A0A286BVM3_9GAMM|nr:glycosyltransferase [Pantoea floridensis]PIF20675.1 glycosyltransferase involved in cell wall biosynthesis [Enterobacteriaceae bacterium JKS000233]SOD38192.1 Glycosyltransferase involved in cell wall bisynthesis [Pantoea floridensis]